MNEQQSKPQATEARGADEHCACGEILERLGDCLGVSPAARQHLRNSRVEFLKAIRELLDQRIAHLSSTGQAQGTKVRVE